MASGDLKILEQSSLMGRGGRLYNVAAGTLIYAGEPVSATLGGVAVIPAVTSTPVVGTDYYAGVAVTNSTNTATAAGTVYVLPITMGTTYLVTPDVAASWDTQAEYDALTGKRVLLKLSAVTGGSYTLLASDSANNGCVVQALDIAKYPGKVAIAFRNGVSVLS